jgi:hypothetical protein
MSKPRRRFESLPEDVTDLDRRLAIRAGWVRTLDGEDWVVRPPVYSNSIDARIAELEGDVTKHTELLQLRAENARFVGVLRHIQCKSCGATPAADPGWQWAYTDAYRNGHIIQGAPPDLCGPVEFVPLEPESSS